MSENNFFPDSFPNSFPSIKRVSSSSLEDKLSKEILPYEIEFCSKNTKIVFPLYEKMRYNKMKELVPFDNYIGRYIIIKNVKDLNGLNNNNGIILKIIAVDNMMLKLENINAPGSSMNFSSSSNIANNSKYKPIDLCDKEYENKIFLVEYAFLSKSFPDNFIIIVSNFYNNNSLLNKEPNGEVYYCGFSFNFSSNWSFLISPTISDTDKGLIFHDKIKANSLIDIKNKFFGNNTNYNLDKNIFINENNWFNNSNDTILMNHFSNNINLYKNFLLCMEINKKYKNFLRNIEYKEIQINCLRKYILHEIVYDNNLYLLLDYNKKYDSFLLKKYFDGGQSWINSQELMNDKNNNIIVAGSNCILCNELKGLVCMSSLQHDTISNNTTNNLNNNTINNFSNINNYFNKFNYEFENTISVPIFDNPIYESKIILNNRRELLSHLECSKCTYKINEFQAYLCQTCKKLYHKGCIDKDEKKNPLLYHYFFCNQINCSPCVICKGNQQQLSNDKYQCKKCKFVFHSKCLIKEIRDIYINLNKEHFLCENCIQCSKCGLNAYNLNTEKKDNKFNCETNICLYCERKINKKEYCKICDELWYNKDANLLIECSKCKYIYHKTCDKIIITNINNNLFKKTKYSCPFCRINKKISYINNLIKELRNLDQNEYFVRPVNQNDFPNYSKVIKNPICFEDIENKNLKDNIYLKDMDLFFKDLILIPDNAMTFNMPRTPVYELAVEMKKNMEKKLNENYNTLYQFSMDYWLFDFNEEEHIKNSDEERLNFIKNNFLNIFWKYIQNKNKNYSNDDKDNINENKKENKNEINIIKFREEFAKFGNEYIQKNIFEYCITWNWLSDIGLTPYNKDIKIQTNFNSQLIDNISDNNNQNNDINISIEHKNNIQNQNNTMKTNLKKKFKSYDEISYELDFHNSNFESSKKVSKFIISSNSLSHTMELILNKHKNLDYLDTNELLFNNYEKNIDNDKKLSFLYPEKFRYYLPTNKQNLKSAFNDFMSSFIIKLEDNKKGKNFKKKVDTINNNNLDKDANFDLDDDEVKDDDKNDLDYSITGSGKKRKNNKKGHKTKKKKFGKIGNNLKSLSSQKIQKDYINNENGIINKNNMDIDENIVKNNNDENNISHNNVNNENSGVLLNVNINSNKDENINNNTDLTEKEYLKKELTRKLSMKFITVAFNKFGLIFEPNCALCGSFEDSDKFIFCTKCENSFHYYCIDESIDINKIKELNNWRCSSCKICMKCNENISINDIIYKNDNILFCKSCDNCCHVKCLSFVMNTESYKYKCENCFKCVMCKSNKYYDENFPLNKNKDYSFFTRDYDYCYECGLTVFYNSLCNKCLLSDFKNYSKKLIFIKTRSDLENFEKDYNINPENIFNINISENNEKNEIADKYIIMLYCDSCKYWCHGSCFGMNYFQIKEYFNKFNDIDVFICLDCHLKNKLGDKYNKLSAITYLEILSTSFKLMVLSKIILIILKGHYKEVNSSVKLHSKLIKTFIKNNYETMLKNKNLQLLFLLFKLDIFLIKDTNNNISAKKKKSKNNLNNAIDNFNDKINNIALKDNKNNINEKNKMNNIIDSMNDEDNFVNDINIDYDEEIEKNLNKVSKEQYEKKVSDDKYWQKHLMRLLMKKYRRKSWYQRMHKKKLLVDIAKENDYNYKFQFDKNIINGFSENIFNREKFNELSTFNMQTNTQSIINFEVKNFLKTENEYNLYDYPSDLEINPEENMEEDNNILSSNTKLLGNKKNRPFEINIPEKDKENISQNEKSKNDLDINKNKKNKCYYVMYGDKKRFRKILKKYTKNSMNNSSLNNIKNYIPDSIIDMYEYNINEYFNQDEEKENENIDEITLDKNNQEIKSLIQEVYYNLISLRNNYSQNQGEKIINYSSKINTFIICVIFGSIRYIRELLLTWLINILLEESNSNNIYKNVEEIISKSDNNANTINIEELNKYFDHIDKLIESPNNNQECILCHRKGGRELSGRLVYIKDEIWIHINCLVWSKGILLNNYTYEISQIDYILNKSSSFKCFLCKRGGATLFCNVPKCERKYHFLCGYTKKCSFMKDYRVFCNRCSHCYSDDSDEAIKANLNRLFIVNCQDSIINENANLGNAFKDRDTPKYQVGAYNKTGNNTILKFFLINSKEHSFETLDLAILKVKLISKSIEMIGVNEIGTYYFTQFNIDENIIKNALIKNGINNCIQQSDFNGLIKDLENNKNESNEINIDLSKKDEKNDMEIEQEENKDNKSINKVKNYIFIEPMKNKDNSLNLNYCKNRIERNENVEYILVQLNKEFLKINQNNLVNEKILNTSNKNKNEQKKLEIFKYFNFGYDIKKIYSSNNPISIIHQYLAKFSLNMPGLNNLENINYSGIESINIDNKEDNYLSQNNSININKINSIECHSTNNNNNDLASDIMSINTITNNLNDCNNKEVSTHLTLVGKKKSKNNNSNNNNNLLNNNLSKLDYFVNLINKKNKINFNQTNHLCFKLENYIISHQELISEKTKLTSEESQFPLKEENLYQSTNPKKRSSNKKYNNKNSDLNIESNELIETNDEQEIAQKYKTYINQPNLKVCIGPSIIHRNGLFALDNIKPGEIVIEYVGEMITNKIADYREIEYNERGFGDCYMFRFDADNIIDATKYGNLARFINHCCEPNCKAQCNEINGKKHILLLAKKGIKAGEEITYDYNFEVESEKIQCRCGAKNCRGRLN